MHAYLTLEKHDQSQIQAFCLFELCDDIPQVILIQTPIQRPIKKKCISELR